MVPVLPLKVKLLAMPPAQMVWVAAAILPPTDPALSVNRAGETLGGIMNSGKSFPTVLPLLTVQSIVVNTRVLKSNVCEPLTVLEILKLRATDCPVGMAAALEFAAIRISPGVVVVGGIVETVQLLLFTVGVLIVVFAGTTSKAD
jgi:hypothetical protein